MEMPVIEIGIIQDKKISFFLHGKYYADGFSSALIGDVIAEIENGKLKIQTSAGTSCFSGSVFIVPGDINRDLAEIHQVRIGIQFHWDERTSLHYQGTIKLMQEGDAVQLVNCVPLENYLRSVISSEMSASSSLDLLKAHAVISRSWLLAQMYPSPNSKKQYLNPEISDEYLIRWYDKQEHTRFNVCADDHCQRYYGLQENLPEKVADAIRETSGIVMMDGDDYCDSRFSKCCGGITETFQNTWEPVPKNYLLSITDWPNNLKQDKPDLTSESLAMKWISSQPDAFCNTNDSKVLDQILTRVDASSRDFYRWKKSYTQIELSGIIREKTGIDFGSILDLVPVERGESGRLIKLKILGTKKNLTIGKELEIRRILSPTHLYSSAFYVEKEDVLENIPQKFILNGAGWGHGVGLCQIGAAVMGEKGYSWKQILEHYFRNITIKKIY